MRTTELVRLLEAGETAKAWELFDGLLGRGHANEHHLTVMLKTGLSMDEQRPWPGGIHRWTWEARAGGDWHHSAFADIRVVRAAASKVHLDAEIRRFTAGDRLITSFRSLWVITNESGRWAAKMRSSFAPE